MFGYVSPDNPNMYVKDVVLYKSLYCGLCKSISASCGEKARLTLSYDLAFLSGFLHNIMNTDVVINKEFCIVHHLKKRAVAKPTELSKKIGALNMILAYEKLNDDVLDENKGNIKRAFFTSSYKKIKDEKLKEIVKNGYKKLVEYEKKGEGVVSVSADFFGQMLYDLVKYLSNEYFTESVGTLSYNLGKWIYVIDALDDFDKDKKKGNYNPFVIAYKEFSTKKDLIEGKKQEIQFIFSDILSEIYYANKNIKYYFNHDLIDNILEKGLLLTTKKIMEK